MCRVIGIKAQWATNLKNSALDNVFKKDRAGSGPKLTRNLTHGSRVFKNPNQTGSLFGEAEVN